jgi:hypothetical protein
MSLLLAKKAVDALRRLVILLKTTKVQVVLIGGLFFGGGKLAMHMYNTKHTTWAFMSPTLLSKAEDFLQSCTTLRNVYRFEMAIKNRPFHGQLSVTNARCENDEFNLDGDFSLTNTGNECSSSGTYLAEGNTNVAKLRFFNISPSVVRIPCVPVKWDIQVWLIRKELLVPYWESLVKPGE